MMEVEFLKSLVIIFGTSALVVFVLHKLKIPTIVGFLVAGILIGPHGIRIIEDIHSIEMLAEIGVILLLFTIGIEFSMAKLIRIKKAVIGGGSIQVLLTIILSAIAAYFVTENINKSISSRKHHQKVELHAICLRDRPLVLALERVFHT